MYLCKIIMFTLLITLVKSLFAKEVFDKNNITIKDLNRLKQEYSKFMELRLNRNDFYANEYPGNLNAVVCPKPWDNTPAENDVLFFEDMKVVGKKLSDLLEPKFTEEFLCEGSSYVKCYATVLNAIESVGITYMYRFCDYAIKMNEKGLSIAKVKINFSNLLNEIKKVFEYESLSIRHINCVTTVYMNYYIKYNHLYDTDCQVRDDDYMDGLSECMEEMKPKIDFTDLYLEDDFLKNINEIFCEEMVYDLTEDIKNKFQKPTRVRKLYECIRSKIN